MKTEIETIRAELEKLQNKRTAVLNIVLNHRANGGKESEVRDMLDGPDMKALEADIGKLNRKLQDAKREADAANAAKNKAARDEDSKNLPKAIERAGKEIKSAAKSNEAATKVLARVQQTIADLTAQKQSIERKLDERAAVEMRHLLEGTEAPPATNLAAEEAEIDFKIKVATSALKTAQSDAKQTSEALRKANSYLADLQRQADYKKLKNMVQQSIVHWQSIGGIDAKQLSKALADHIQTA